MPSLIFGRMRVVGWGSDSDLRYSEGANLVSLLVGWLFSSKRGEEVEGQLRRSIDYTTAHGDDLGRSPGPMFGNVCGGEVVGCREEEESGGEGDYVAAVDAGQMSNHALFPRYILAQE